MENFFEWINEKRKYYEEQEKKRDALVEEKRLLNRQIDEIDKFLDTPFHTGNIVRDTIMSTPLGNVVLLAEKKGFKTGFYPKRIENLDMDESLGYLSISGKMIFEKPLKISRRLAEKAVDFACYCLESGTYICVMEKEARDNFHRWMFPIFCVKHGNIIKCKDEEDNEIEHDIMNDLSEGFKKDISRFKDDHTELIRRAREEVIGSMTAYEGFAISFSMTDKKTIETYGGGKWGPGVRISSLFGCVDQLALVLSTDMKSRYEDSKPIMGSLREVYEKVEPIVEEYARISSERRGKNVYDFWDHDYVNFEEYRY